MNNIQEISRINKREFELGIVGGGKGGSWHDEYKDSAWVFVGSLSYELSEGDVICVMSQWGEVEDIRLVRDKATNKSQGFAFVKYEDQRSTILAVDNFNGVELLGRTMRVDHVHQYKLPKDVLDREAERLEQDPDAEVDVGPGHAYKNKELKNEFDIHQGVDLWAPPTVASTSSAAAAAAAAAAGSGAPAPAKEKRKRSDKSSDKKAEKKAKKEAKKASKLEKKKEKKEGKEKKERKEKKSKNDKLEKQQGGPAVEVKRERASKWDAAPPQQQSGLAAAAVNSAEAALAPLPPAAGIASWRGTRDPLFQADANS